MILTAAVRVARLQTLDVPRVLVRAGDGARRAVDVDTAVSRGAKRAIVALAETSRRDEHFTVSDVRNVESERHAVRQVVFARCAVGVDDEV